MTTSTLPATDPPPRTIAAPVGLVNDFAGVLSEPDRTAIAQMANDVRAKSPGEIAVVTLKDIGQQDASAVASAIWRQWKVGKRSKTGGLTQNTGVVILIVPQETNSIGEGVCWISAGRSTEAFITNASAGEMCREALPLFRQRDYGSAVKLVTYRVAQRFAQQFHFALDTISQLADRS